MQISVDLVKSTEAAALAAFQWIGSGKSERTCQTRSDPGRCRIDYSTNIHGSGD